MRSVLLGLIGGMVGMVIVLMVLGRLLFGMQMAGSWPMLIGAYLCGAVALVPYTADYFFYKPTS